MTLELWGAGNLPYLGPPGNVAGYAVLVAYALVLLAAIVQTGRDFLRLRPGQWVLLGALALIAPLAITSLRLRFHGAAPPPGIPLEPAGPTLSLLGYAPVFLAAGLLGSGPALLVGLSAGLARAGWETYRLTTVFEVALAAGLLSWLIRQEYSGLVPRVARLPIVAGLGSALSIWLVSFLSFVANSTVLGLVGLDFVAAQWAGSALPLFGELLLGGIFGTLARLAWPAAWPSGDGRRPPPYSTSLQRRLLFTLLPLSFFGLLILIWANLRIADQVATALIVDQMGRNAESVANSVPYFAQTGQSTLNSLASDLPLPESDPGSVRSWFSEQIRVVPFFRSLSLYDRAGGLVATYPAANNPAEGLAAEEWTALQLGVPQTITLYPQDRSVEGVQLSFIVPLVDRQRGGPGGTLIGRTAINDNPLLRPAIDQLQSISTIGGQGMILDERNTIIYSTDPDLLLQTWTPAEQPAESLTTAVPGGTVYRDRAPGNTRRLVYYLPVSGYPWSVVIILPNDVVLAQAAQITAPLVAILIAMGAMGASIVLWLISRITRPLETLARATASIEQGEFDRPVQIAGEDEVGRLGVAFERMRERLRARLGELNMLLNVSQSIAASLDLDESLPAVLDSALTIAGAGGVRLILPTGDGAPPQVFAAGPLNPAMAPLDQQLLTLTEAQGRIALENLNRARGLLDVRKGAGQVQALIALPLRQESVFLGTFWIGFGQPHRFSESEVNFVSTLGGQAAVALSNYSLYQASEGGRQRLQAILASSPDAVIVTDRHERVLLLNPAAESVFAVSGPTANGRPLAEVIERPELIELLRHPSLATPREVPLDDGRTLFASASPITGADGALVGQVAVLRDVTHFKQLDELKSEFVATVSHDLRVPLTFMRGYANMLPMVGQLNPKQVEFADKIVLGIEQMSDLIEDLLDLNRIEAGVGLARETCNLVAIVNSAIGNLRNNAANKNIALTSQVAADLPAVFGDTTLLRQALANLIDNAVKYTPSGGRVRVAAEVRDQSVVLAVQDTGIGIAASDQPRLFEKFFRVKQRDTIAIKGSGLGLAIVKSIVERHGGRVWVESRLGQGSTFYMSLPL